MNERGVVHIVAVQNSPHSFEMTSMLYNVSTAHYHTRVQRQKTVTAYFMHLLPLGKQDFAPLMAQCWHNNIKPPMVQRLVFAWEKSFFTHLYKINSSIISLLTLCIIMYILLYVAFCTLRQYRDRRKPSHGIYIYIYFVYRAKLQK